MAVLPSKSFLFGVMFAAGALILGPSSGAFAHDHHGGACNGSDSHCHHHHHHHDKGPGGLGPVHGSGSSHNPIVGNPSPMPIVRDHRKPKIVRDHRTPKVVRDHRPTSRGPRYDPRCNKHNTTGCKVRDHRTPPKPQCYGNLC